MRVCKKMVIYLGIKRKYTWQKTHVYRVAGMIASICGKKQHVYRVVILKQMADHSHIATAKNLTTKLMYKQQKKITLSLHSLHGLRFNMSVFGRLNNTRNMVPNQLNKNIWGSVSKLTKLHSRIQDGWFFVHIVLFLWNLHSPEFKQQLSCSKLQMAPCYKKE